MSRGTIVNQLTATVIRTATIENDGRIAVAAFFVSDLRDRDRSTFEPGSRLVFQVNGGPLIVSDREALSFLAEDENWSTEAVLDVVQRRFAAWADDEYLDIPWHPRRIDGRLVWHVGRAW